MRINTSFVPAMSMLALLAAAGCADPATITGADPGKANCPRSNLGESALCRSLVPSHGASASLFYEHDVSGLSGTSYTSYANPTTGYLEGTTRIDFSGFTDNSYYGSISDGVQAVSFEAGELLQKRTVPSTWATWSKAPYAESETPHVLYSTSQLTALTFSTPVAAVGFELEGNEMGPAEYLVEYYDNTYKLLGFVRRTVEGWEGSRLFSFSTDWPNKISRVEINTEAWSFGLAQVRYSLTPLAPETPPVTDIAIDIKPGTTPNDVQRNGKGKLPVAVLTTSTFNAATLDVMTIRLGDEAGQDTPVATQGKGKLMAAMKDVDEDGDLDLILQFEIPALVANGDLTTSTTQLVLTAAKIGGEALRGTDNVVVKK